MKVKAVSSIHCTKCQQAKFKLKDYPIEWYDVDNSSISRNLGERFDVDVIPCFLVFDDSGTFIRKTNNVLEIRDMFRDAEKD